MPYSEVLSSEVVYRVRQAITLQDPYFQIYTLRMTSRFQVRYHVPSGDLLL